jgi:DNA-binding transcriptional LysR family regulator
MRFFAAVCEENSITKAAQKLHVAQPAVSVAVKELEEYYGVKLFDRISRRLHLTDAGRKLLEYAVPNVALFDDMESSVRSWERSGKVRVGASITIGTHLMPEYVSAFLKDHPEAKVEVVIGSSDLIEKKILQNELDFALIEGTVHSDSLLCDTYQRDRLVVVCSPNSPLLKGGTITPEQLLSQPLLLREVGSGTRELFDHVMASLEYTYTPAWESTSTQALVLAVSKGLGVSVLSFLFVKEELEKGMIAELQVENMRFDRGFHVIYHKNKHLTELSRSFIEMCRDFGAQASRALDERADRDL